MTETLLYERTSDGLAWITLNRSDALNAINMQMPHVILSADHFCFVELRSTRRNPGWGILPRAEVGFAMTCECSGASPALNATTRSSG
ncbi:MAG: hypothetical protein E6I09_04450 [Chloroflexi bacterium]|nr:MAG: hypothetical protein E6I09_04450 [Chloroflexota bacterium]